MCVCVSKTMGSGDGHICVFCLNRRNPFDMGVNIERRGYYGIFGRTPRRATRVQILIVQFCTCLNG